MSSQNQLPSRCRLLPESQDLNKYYQPYCTGDRFCRLFCVTVDQFRHWICIYLQSALERPSCEQSRSKQPADSRNTSMMTTAGAFVLLSFVLCCFPDAALGVEVDCSKYPNTTNEEGREMLICSEILGPICGSDGITYSNECLLCSYNIEYGTNVSKDHDGECKEVAPVDCSRYPNTTNEEGKEVFLCSKDFSFVCGTDGITYDNECQLCARSSETGTKIGKKSDGECKKDIATVDCSGHPKPGCVIEYRPVCGSDSKTYSNKCEFCNAVVDSNGTLILSHFGKC